MTERIIPIQVEGRDESTNREATPESDKEQSELSKSLEELSVESKRSPSPCIVGSSDVRKPTIVKVDVHATSSPKVRVKPAPVTSSEINDGQEYLKGFDVLEKRDGNAVLSEYTLRNSDVLERIILVIDRAQDENYTPFIIGTQKYTPFSMVKRAISIFIKLKLGIKPHHEFAIIIMNENQACLQMEFTSDSRKLLECLNKITECETEDIFDLNSVFNIIEDVGLPAPFAPGLPPPYILRTIIFYGRSYTLPQITMTDKLKAFLNHPFSICDVLMTHEPVEASNHCQKIFDLLQNLDQKGIAYFFPVCRDMRRMHKCTGKLLAHPLQRPIQKLIKN